MGNQHLEQFELALEDWKDERFIGKQELRALAMFYMYLVNLAEDDGWAYAGHSLKMGTPMCTLVVKSWHGEVPQIVFTSARDPTTCIRIFLRKLEEGLLEWRKDQYRG